jgi:hypothetical protein
MTTTQPRLFHLQRDHDVTGVSGTGRVADGVLWPDGTVSLRWIGPRPSVVFWDRLEDAEHVHGHNGATRIVWDDEQPAAADRAAVLRDFLSKLDERLLGCCEECNACAAIARDLAAEPADEAQQDGAAS